MNVVNYDIALELQKLGFKDPTFCIYNREKALRFNNLHNPKDRNQSVKLTSNNGKIAAPLKSEVFEWFRLNYGYEVRICKLLEEIGYMGSIGWEGVEDFIKQLTNNTYKETENDCIIELINIVKNEKKEKSVLSL